MRKKMISRRSFLKVAGVSSLCLAAAGCGAASTSTAAVSTASGSASSAAPAADKAVVLSVSSPAASLDPMGAEDTPSMNAVVNTNEGLFVQTAEGEIVNGLCEKYTVSDDQLTWTFTLRDTAWNDGTPVTSADFLYSWQRNADPANASLFAYQIEMSNMKNQADVLSGSKPLSDLGCTAPDDKTIVIELDAPCSYLTDLLAFSAWSPINQAFCEKEGDVFGTTKDDILYDGPYMVSDWQAGGSEITFSKNPNYWDAANVDVSSVTLRVVEDTQTAVMSYETGDLDYVKLTGDLVNQYSSDPDFTEVDGNFNYYLMYNTPKGGALGSQTFRQAVAYAIDRESLCKQVLEDGSQPAYTLVMRNLVSKDGVDFVDACEQMYKYDADKAKTLWEQAKKELGTDTVSFTITYDQEKDFAKDAAAFIQSAVENTLAGVTVELESTPKQNRIQKAKDGDFDTEIWGWGPDYADATAILAMEYSTHPSNYSGYKSADFDASYDEANSTLAGDANARWDALVKCANIYTEGASLTPLFQTGSACLTRSGLTGVTEPVTGHTFYKFLKYSV